MSKKKAITNQYNKLRRWDYLDASGNVDFSFLFEYTLYNDSTENLKLFHLNLTFNTKPPEYARNLASDAIKKHLEEVYNKVYTENRVYETIAHQDSNQLFKNYL